MNAEREIILVGTVLSNPNLYPVAAKLVSSGDFADTFAALTWGQIALSWRVGITADQLLLDCYAAHTPDGRKWVHDAVNDIIPLSTLSVEATARKLAENGKRRRTALELRRIADLLNATDSTGMTLNDAQEALQAIVRDIVGRGNDGADIASVLERVQQTIELNKKRGGIVGLDTGYHDLQSAQISYQPGHLWVIGGWTSTGKTAWLVDAVCRFLRANQTASVAVFSTEMTDQQNAVRMLANRASVGTNAILSGDVHRQDEEALSASWGWLRERKLWLYQNETSLESISRQARALSLQPGGLQLLAVDFIQNVTGTGKTQYDVMSNVARKLQALSLELECTIIALSQIPTQAAKEDAGIIEYKGAGEIGAACDIGVVLKRAQEDKRQLLFDIRKNRHGATGMFRLQFNERWTALEELGPVKQ